MVYFYYISIFHLSNNQVSTTPQSLIFPGFTELELSITFYYDYRWTFYSL